MQPRNAALGPGVFTTGRSCRALAVFTIPDPTATGDPVAIATERTVVPAPRTRNPRPYRRHRPDRSDTPRCGYRNFAVCRHARRRVPPHTQQRPGRAAHLYRR